MRLLVVAVLVLVLGSCKKQEAEEPSIQVVLPKNSNIKVGSVIPLRAELSDSQGLVKIESFVLSPLGDTVLKLNVPKVIDAKKYSLTGMLVHNVSKQPSGEYSWVINVYNRFKRWDLTRKFNINQSGEALEGVSGVLNFINTETEDNSNHTNAVLYDADLKSRYHFRYRNIGGIYNFYGHFGHILYAADDNSSWWLNPITNNKILLNIPLGSRGPARYHKSENSLLVVPHSSRIIYRIYKDGGTFWTSRIYRSTFIPPRLIEVGGSIYEMLSPSNYGTSELTHYYNDHLSTGRVVAKNLPECKALFSFSNSKYIYFVGRNRRISSLYSIYRIDTNDYSKIEKIPDVLVADLSFEPIPVKENGIISRFLLVNKEGVYSFNDQHVLTKLNVPSSIYQGVLSEVDYSTKLDRVLFKGSSRAELYQTSTMKKIGNLVYSSYVGHPILID